MRDIASLPSVYAKQLYYDTCSFYGPSLKMARDIVGVERLLWGADDPFIGASPSYLDAADFTPQERAMVLGGNAARIFNLKL